MMVEVEEKKKFIKRLSKQTKRVTTINPKWIESPELPWNVEEALMSERMS